MSAVNTQAVTVTARMAVIALGAIGLVVSERRIRTWREAGQLPIHSRGPHGVNLYDLADVRNLARAELLAAHGKVEA